MNIGGNHNLNGEDHDWIKRIFDEQPGLLTRSELPDPDLMLSRVGIFGLDSTRPRGFVKYSPKDFLVQELGVDGSICEFNNGRSTPDDHQKERSHLHCHLIKTNNSTSQAVNRICIEHGIPRKSVSVASHSGKVGVTSQRISFENVDWGVFKNKQTLGSSSEQDEVRIEPVAYKSEPIHVVGTKGNRFTVLVRGDGSEESERLAYLVDVLRNTGFKNFVSPEKFGTRLEAHKVGCLLARGDVNGAIRTLFLEEGPMDLKLFKQIRQRLAAAYGNWNAMQEILLPYSGSFQREMRLLDRLAAAPAKTHGALKSIGGALPSYIQAYADWVLNRSLSGKSDDLESIMKDDGVTDADSVLEPFNIQLKLDIKKPRVVLPEVHRVVKIPEGTMFSFTLPTHAHSDIFLSHIYRLYEKHPVPGWVRGGEVDLMKRI